MFKMESIILLNILIVILNSIKIAAVQIKEKCKRKKNCTLASNYNFPFILGA